MRHRHPKPFRAIPVLVFASCLLATSCSRKESPTAGSPFEVDSSLQSAQQALEAGQPEKALKLLAPAIRLRPDSPEVLNFHGAILTRLKDFAAARSRYEAALGKSPDFFPARYNIGALMATEGNWEKATDYFRNLVIEMPDNELVQYKLLLLLLSHDGDPALQGRLFSSSVPSNTPAWYFASAARAYSRGNPGEARKLIDVATGIFGKRTAIYQEELDESGLPKHKS
jgi:tetratricopeptide (TPR) repeat protein